MSIELVGFENLPNAFIKDIVITNASVKEDTYEVTIRVHDLPDRSIWSSTQEIFFQLMRVGIIFLTDPEETRQLTSGEISPTSLRYMSKSLAIAPEVTEDNSRFELKFRKNFKTDISNLTIFAFCFISKADTSDSLGIRMQNDYIGPMKSEKVIESMKVVTTTNAFIRADGSYWSGPVHEHNRIFMEGSYHSDRPHNKLSRIQLANNKIKDKRQTKNTSQSNITFSDSFISELFVSYSSDTDVNAMFMINIKTLLIKNTKYGKFISKATQDIIDSLIRRVQFKMLSIQRHRIRPQYRTTGIGNIKRKADKVFFKKNILNTQDDSAGRMLKKMRLERNGSIDALPSDIENISDYKKICDIEELYFNYGTELRCFQFTDYEMTSKTPGDYQYKIELQFSDPVDRFLRDAAVVMKTDIASIIDYSTIFPRRGSSANVAAETIVKNYLDHYSYIYETNRATREAMTLKYINMLNPHTADVSSISKFLKVYRDLYNDFMVFLNYDDQKRINIPRSIMVKERMSRRIIVTKTFDEIITPSNNSLAFSYLPESGNKKTAVYTKSVFMQQSEKEVQEDFVTAPNFSTPQTPADLNAAVSNIQTTKTAHFSPKNYLTGHQKVNLTRTNAMGMTRLNNTLLGEMNKKSQKPQATASRPYVMNPSALTIETVKPPEQETEDGKYLDAEEILGSGHEFVSYTESSFDFNKPSVLTKPQQKFQSKLSGFDNSRTFEATLETVKDITPEEAERLPNQLKSVINGNSEATRKNFVTNGNDLLAHPSTKNFYELKNFSVKEVSYIDNFERDANGNILLNKPIYKTMLLNDFKRLDKPALCFLRDYTNDKFNISGDKQIQAVNSVFIISDEDITAPKNIVVSAPSSTYSTQQVEYQFMNSNIVKQTNIPLSSPVSSTQTTDNDAAGSSTNTTFGSY
jgi:hypothetical protein